VWWRTHRRYFTLSELPIPALTPRGGSGQQFVCYADFCSGIPGKVHETNFAAVNAEVSRLLPAALRQMRMAPGDKLKRLHGEAINAETVSLIS
jgi:hypothetical protein